LLLKAEQFQKHPNKRLNMRQKKLQLLDGCVEKIRRKDLIKTVATALFSSKLAVYKIVRPFIISRS